MDRNRHMATRTAHPVDSVHPVSVSAQIGPRRPGVVYYDGSRMVRVESVITDSSESRRILKRRAAKYAIEVTDLHDGTRYYTGAVWTGSDRVLKAVTV